MMDFSLSVETLESVKDIGPGTANTIRLYFESHKHILKRLLDRVFVIFPKIIETGGILA
jgi:hypothetical protein